MFGRLILIIALSFTILWGISIILRIINTKRKSHQRYLPIYEKPRHRCPFYGFVYRLGFEDLEGNGCAFTPNNNQCSCFMEQDGHTPNWNRCVFNSLKNQDRIQTILEKSRIFPKEFQPENQEDWDGIPFKFWFEYVMGPDVPRPSTPPVNIPFN